MISGILGKKLGMTQIFKGVKCYAATIVAAGPCDVLQVKTQEKDGYSALQLGFEDKRLKSCTKPELGHAKKHANTTPKKFVREVKWDEKETVKRVVEGQEKDEILQAGDKVNLSIFKNIKYIDVIGLEKGRGFQGCVKRWNFKGGPVTHGQSDRLRHPGAISGSSEPSRVFKGIRMGGHMGNTRTTVRDMEILDIDLEKNIIAINGPVPGPEGGYIILRKSVINK